MKTGLIYSSHNSVKSSLNWIYKGIPFLLFIAHSSIVSLSITMVVKILPVMKRRKLVSSTGEFRKRRKDIISLTI